MGSETSLAVVRRLIAETFGVPETVVTRATTADDIDGWDSLSHTILMVRLERALGIALPESVAAGTENVGTLADSVAALHP